MKKWIISALTAVLIATSVFPYTGFTHHHEKDRHLMFILNTRQYYENGSMFLAQAPHQVISGVTFVSMRSLAERLGFQVYYIPETREYGMRKKGENLSYRFDDNNFRHNGEEKPFRAGRSHVVNGSLMIPLRETAQALGITVKPELSANKVHMRWTEDTGKPLPEPDPFSGGIEMAQTEFKIGEKITYDAAFTGSGSKGVRKTWTNNEPAFFVPGEQKVTLHAVNEAGEVITDEITLTITDEVLYTKQQFDAKYTNFGYKMDIDRAEVLEYATVTPERTDSDRTLVRSNSPERINQEGFYYEDVLSGDMRFLIHHQNARVQPVKIYVLARNESSETAEVTVQRTGLAGPNPYVAFTGKHSVAGFLRGLSSDNQETYTIEPGKRIQILTELSERAMLPEQVMTLYTDLHADQDVRFQIVVLEEQNNLNRTLPFLPGVTAARDNRHNRGTFDHGDRTLTVSERIGDDRQRIVIGDGTVDEYVTGFDRLTGEPETNFGNRGVLYHLELEEVAPDTAIVVNPRGGSYSGAFYVNGEVVLGPLTGVIQNPSEALVLYRTGDEAEHVDIKFIPASGSNLPLNFITIPLENNEAAPDEDESDAEDEN